MASKSTTAHRTRQNHSEKTSNERLAETTRQLAFAEDGMAQMFRASESLQRAQQQFSQRAALLHSQAAENLRNASTPAELAPILSNLSTAWMQETVRCYQDLLLICAKLGSEALLQSGMSEVDAGTVDTDTATDATTSAAQAAMNAAAPMMNAWQMLFTRPLAGDWTRH